VLGSGHDVQASGHDVLGSGHDVQASGHDVLASGHDVLACHALLHSYTSARLHVRRSATSIVTTAAGPLVEWLLGVIKPL
jgi:hypothetical protein